MKYDPFVYGKDQTEGVVSVEINNDVATLYTETGEIINKHNLFYILYTQNYNGKLRRLNGSLPYKWLERFDNKSDYQAAVGIAKSQGWDHFRVYNDKEAFMIRSGVTYYKGMTPKDVSVMSFDIETTGLNPSTSQTLMISTTFRGRNKTVRKLFSIDEYNSEKEMIYAFCNWVQHLNPSILLGHNIFSFDLPFLKQRLGKELPIGKNNKPTKTARYFSQFRKDGSQSYDYTNVICPGREIIDTMFLAYKHDQATRKYESYGLKAIIKHEGLERADRQHYDAVKIGEVYARKDLHDEWEKIKKYAEHDADDALALFDLMIPAYFYYCQHIPKTMQQIINSATGSQVNSFMIRAYLSEGHSLPMASEVEKYQGAISFGNPGIYRDVVKFDVASLYPSIILEHKIYNPIKDPKAYFLKMVDYFTTERLKNKELGKVERTYYNIEQAQKIVINSAYGFLGAPGLQFNSPVDAKKITRIGREYLNKGIEWAEGNHFRIVNADTDSFSYIGSRNVEQELTALNSQFPDQIRWENDGEYSHVIVVKAKNYVLKDKDTGKVKIKGSALKATMKEPALKDFTNDIIYSMIEEGKYGKFGTIYKNYIRDISRIDNTNISRWASKKTITKSVLNPKRSNEGRIKEALERAQKVVQEGDKIWVFFETETKLTLVEAFNGSYCKKKLLGKLFKTAEIFKPVLSMSQFPNLTLKRNQSILEEILKEGTPSQPGDGIATGAQTNL